MTGQKKNILFFTHHLGHGGAEKAVRTLARYFHGQEGYESYVCVVYDDPEFHGEVDNLIVMEHRSRPEDGKMRKACRVLLQIAELRRIKRRYAIDCCISFLPGADLINVSSGAGERQIVSVRNRESLFVSSVFKKWYVQYSYRRCDHIAAVTELVRRDCMKCFGVPENRITTIHNAVPELRRGGEPLPEEERRMEEEAERFCRGHEVFVNVARLAPEKGQDTLLRALAAACRTRPGLRLMILGEGPRREELTRLASQLGLSEQVLFAGNRRAPQRFLRMADVFVLSSVVEGMPNALLEAMQCGLPCISTECGAREILAPGTDCEETAKTMDIAEYGILVPVGEETALAGAMLRMLEEPALRERFRERAADCLRPFATEAVGAQWADVIEGRV
ncbi:glycosyltransferase [Lachnoclostridium sp. Marseille-P6806]|uniref:glycosyltransferase n=1 Tax=Lachnoclostridium sp. Marseille-P6806 TaxID=2364793 RepID=UPI00102F491B|nr:glycosyltransferase [Lachnoclostridium sp. Marseille-P6806]